MVTQIDLQSNNTTISNNFRFKHTRQEINVLYFTTCLEEEECQLITLIHKHKMQVENIN